MILDIATAGQCSLVCVRRILASQPGTRILVVGERRGPPILQRALNAGARGYASKNISSQMLVQAIHEVTVGWLFIEPELARKMVLDQVLGKQNPIETLSGREYEIMCLLVTGKPVGEIAKAVNLSRNTVANYHTHILQKLSVANDVQLTHLAIQQGIVNA